MFALLFLVSSISVADLRDPTRPASYVMSGSSSQAASEAPAYQLQAVFYSPTQRGALINGQRYHVGDQLGNARIQSINVDRVTLLTPEGQLELTLNMPQVKSRHEQNTAEESVGLKNVK